jgi:hypothetical protein
MSEPDSLYVRITMSAQALRAFRTSAPASPLDYDDWLGWLATRKWHGSITAEELVAQAAQDMPKGGTSVGNVLDGLCNGIPAQYAYSADTNRCTLLVALFSESYDDFIVTLAMLRAAAKFKDLPGDDIVLIFPYFWDETPGICLRIQQGASTFLTETPTEVMEEACAGMKALQEQMNAKFDFDAL